MPKLITSLKTFVEAAEPFVKVLILPLFAGAFYVATTWLNSNYVNKTEFKATIVELRADRERGEQEQKLTLKEMNGKLDSILQSNAANSQRFTDTERRLSRLEDKVDGLKEK